MNDRVGPSVPGTGEPRLAPLDRADLSPYARQIFDDVPPGGAVNLVATLAHQPALFERFLGVTLALQQGELGWRRRELVVLRLAYRRRCRYIWRQHVAIGRAAGMTEDEVALVAGAPDHPHWPPEESALLRAVDQLVEDSGIDRPTWAALASILTPAQLVELTILVGHYSGMAYLANSAVVLSEADPADDPRLEPW
jgi:4-carboxymuconolactone decarboxylase